MSSHPAEQDAAEGGRGGGGGGNPDMLDILKPRTMMGLVEDAPEEPAPDDERLQKLLSRHQGGVVIAAAAAAAEKEELPHMAPHTQQLIVSAEHKMSGLQWGIPHQHPALATTAAAAGVVVGAGNTKNQGTIIDHQRHYLPDSSSPFFDLAHQRRGLLERNWETMGLDISGDDNGDNFGYSLSMSADGKRLAVLAQSDPVIFRVYEYKSSNTWEQLGSDITAESDSESFGGGIALSPDGNRVASAARVGFDGTVRVFRYESGDWSKLGGNINGEGGPENFGGDVSLSYDGQRLVVGANAGTGYVRVYDYSETNGWEQTVQIDGKTGFNERFGCQVSLTPSGNRLAVGAYEAGGQDYQTSPGLTRVYEYNSTDWVQLGVDILGEAVKDISGIAVSLSADGNRVAIGAWRNDGTSENENHNSGHARVYEYSSPTGWSQFGQDIDGDAASDHFGRSVALSEDGTRLAVSSKDANYVRTYSYQNLAWVQVGLEINAGTAADWCGLSVSMSDSGDHLAIGCPGLPGGNELPGYVRVFELPPLPAIFDLFVSLDSVAISLTNNTDFSEAIVFQYSYTGNTRGEDPRLTFTYDIRKGDCETPFAPHGNKSMALYFNDFDDETIDNTVIAKLGINLTTIEGAHDVWTQDNGETQAVLKFCGVWNIFVENVLFQFHESNVTATINLKEDGGFTVNELDVGLDRQDANALAEDVKVQFPLDVFICDDDADTTDLPSGGFTQGDVIQVCIMVKNTTTADVYVEGINKMIYSATDVNTTMTLIDNGSLNYGSTAAFDCSHDGICRIKFVAMAGMYVNTPNNILYTEGFATIAFGSDPDARRRRMAFTGHSERSMRRIQENGAAAAAELAPFEFAVGNLQPSSSGLESVGDTEHFGIVISVVLGIAVVIIAAVVIAAFFVYRRRTSMMMMQPAVVAAEGLEKDETEDDGSSSQLAETNESDDSYEIVEV